MRILPPLFLLLSASLLPAAEPKVQSDIPYAEPKNERQTLDVYAPGRGKNHPVVVWIHGGGWHSGDKKDVRSKPQAFVDRGFVFVSINYRLWPGVTIRQIAADVAKAIRWTHDHVRDHGGDPNTLLVMGHSAGAQLAALVCTDERYLKAEKLSLALVKGCVPVDGDTFDLPMRFATVRKSGNKKLAEVDKKRFGDETSQKNLSSITHIARGKNIPPFLILHVADHPDTRGQSQRLLQALQAADVPAKIHPAPGKNHTTLNDDLGVPDDRPTRALFDFLGEVLKKPGAASAGEALEPWASNHHPRDVARRHVEAITTSRQEYRIKQGGTMDGTNCQSPIGGGFGIWDQTWESNRAVRLENVGATEVINPWLSNGHNDCGSDPIADYHFELSDRADLAWPLSSNFEKLVSKTADHGQARYSLSQPGLLTPGITYYWRVRARNDRGVWCPWSRPWSFVAGGPTPPLDVRLEPASGGGERMVLRWKANPAGWQPVTYRVYGSDEKGFSVSDAPCRVNVGRSRGLPAQFPSSFVAETKDTELIVLGTGMTLPNANRAFYRVVAVDDRGKRSGPSDYAAAPRPFIHGKPVEMARVGSAYRYQVATIRSLGDLRRRIVDGAEVIGFWDVEQPRFALVKGPSWLHLDEKSGVLSGVPDAPGKAEIVVRVTLERTARRLDDARLSWGHELVKEVVTEKVGSTTQKIQVTIVR